MTDQDLLSAFSHALRAVAALPEEEEREHFKQLLSQGVLSFLSALEEYAMSKALLNKMQYEIHNKSLN